MKNTPTDTAILSESQILEVHPDELGISSILYLKSNPIFLAEYEIKWAAVIAPRQAGRKHD